VIAANPAPPEKPKAASKKAPTGKNVTKERRGEKRKDAAAQSLRTERRKRQTPEKQDADKVKENNARKGKRKDNANRKGNRTDNAKRAARRKNMTGDDLLYHIHGTTGAAMTMNSRRLRALTPGSEAFKECARDVCRDLECGNVTNRDSASMVRDFIE
jgi:hypothetical protein